jgi:hypothetical protein
MRNFRQLLLTVLLILLLAPLGLARAEIPPVQELHGSLALGQTDVFRLAGLKKGQTLTDSMENNSGHLDISVLYITLFLKDYTRRIEIATGNLLHFLAFSLSLGDNYPRMGYLTFLDAIISITFIINTLVVALNVYYKWLEQKGEREKADRLEAPINYIYPIAYLVAFGITFLIFFV